MCHGRCCLGIVGQLCVPSDSSFLEVTMNKDFWGLLFYFENLSVALNAMVLGELLWIHQEDPEDIIGYFTHTLAQSFGSLEHGLARVV